MKSPLVWFLLMLPLGVLNCAQEYSTPELGTTQSELAVCGDGSCAPGEEDCGTCPGDCPCPGGFVCSSRQCVPVCGDGSCAPGAEDCGTCPVDCPCPDGLVCSNRQCVSADPCGGDPCCGDICCTRPHLCCQVQAANGEIELQICQ